jgi:hypothetical protein
VLDPSWSDWFDGFSISTQEGNTILIGIVPDQSALHGILAKINDLGLSIILVTKIFQEPEIKCEKKIRFEGRRRRNMGDGITQDRTRWRLGQPIGVIQCRMGGWVGATRSLLG